MVLITTVILLSLLRITRIDEYIILSIKYYFSKKEGWMVMNSVFKRVIVDITMMIGIFEIIRQLWVYLEGFFNESTDPSKADTIIAMILGLILWNYVRKWTIVIGENIKN